MPWGEGLDGILPDYLDPGVGGETDPFIINLIPEPAMLTIVVMGALGWRPGASLRRGTIVAMQPGDLLPTYSFACRYQPNFLRLYLLHLRRFGLPIRDAQLNGSYRRYSGDSIELNRGEILYLDN